MKLFTAIRDLLPFIGGSLAVGLLLIFIDAVYFGSYLFSFFIWPIWFVIALIRTRHASKRVAVARVLIALVTGLFVIANSLLQNEIAISNAERIIGACKRYEQANGAYPNKLNDLVPEYLDSIPTAKYCCIDNAFHYYGGDAGGQPTLSWTDLPPFGRKVYRFETGSWHYVD